MVRKTADADLTMGGEPELEGEIFGVLDAPPQRDSPSARVAAAAPLVAEFNEAAYLLVYPDAAASVAAHKTKSAFDHYLMVGREEGRLEAREYIAALSAGMPLTGSGSMPFSVDAMFVSDSGVVLVVGWLASQQEA